MKNDINEVLLNSFISLVNTKTGLVIRPQDRDLFKQKIVLRMQSLKQLSADDYYLLLSTKTEDSNKEWSRLTSLLTNNESYFFRDKDQFALLRKEIFPELIERKRYQKKIRICSLGCSTGQEIYSLTILLKEIIPNFQSWNLLILGVDIDKLALKEAEKGIYGAWSFRGTEDRIKQEYFQKIKDQYHLKSDIKNMVRFQQVNLINDLFPLPDFALREMDLIMCRNVFIYFNSDSIKKVISKVYNTLQPLGYFITGHTELSEQKLDKFKTLVFPQSIVYQRPEKAQEKGQVTKIAFPKLTTPTQPEITKNYRKFSLDSLTEKATPSLETNKIDQPTIKAKIVPSSPVIKSLTEEELLKQGEDLLKQEKYDLAIAKIKELLVINNQNIKAYNLLAQIYANLTQYQQAIEFCHKALQIDELNLTAYKLLAQIAEEQNNLEEAKRILKQIIYFKPLSISVYFDLSFIYEKEGDLTRMKKMRESAIDLLKQIPPTEQIEELGNLTALELINKWSTEI